MVSVERFLAKNTFYCGPLKARISLAQCERNRNAPDSLDFRGGLRRPFQCKKCDWQAEQQKPKPRRARKMPTKEPQVCQECGETKILLTKTLCHACHGKKRTGAEVKPAAKASKPKAKPQSRELTISFDQDHDLFEALSEEAHANYRNPESEILSLLRTVFYDTDRVEKRPTAGA